MKLGLEIVRSASQDHSQGILVHSSTVIQILVSAPFEILLLSIVGQDRHIQSRVGTSGGSSRRHGKGMADSQKSKEKGKDRLHDCCVCGSCIWYSLARGSYSVLWLLSQQGHSDGFLLRHLMVVMD